MTDHRSVGARLRRRLVSVPVLFAAAVVITASIPIWAPVAVVVDAVRGRLRLPTARLLAFGVCWAWLETVGVLRAFGHWLTGRARDDRTNYELMRWWSDALVHALRVTIGIDPRVEHVEALVSGDAVVLSRHASLADSLLSAWAICGHADVWPRYVLKRELLFDPCLDIVGLRVPNHFLDRTSGDAVELDALRSLASGIGPGIVAVIFPEGTRSNDRKRARALARIGARDPDRAERLAELRRLLPPRSAGTRALLEGAPDADVVFAWHTGFDGLDSFGGMRRRLSEPLPPVRFVARRVARAEVPSGVAFDRWLDAEWLRMDAEVDAALTG